MLKSLKAAAASVTAIALSGTAASAGGLADQIIEAPVVVEDPVDVDPVAGSLPGWVIPAAIVAVLVGVAVSSNNKSSDDDPSDEVDTVEEIDDGGDDGGKGDGGKGPPIFGGDG